MKQNNDLRIKQVLQILQKHKVQINKKKTVLKATSIEYLGFHISGEGIKPSPRKLKAIVEAPDPTSALELQSFIGMVTYDCKFV